MIITNTTFKGIRPKTASHLIGLDEAQTAQNVKIDNGQLNAWYNQALIDTSALTSTVQTIYYYESEYWLEFSADVDIVQGPVAGNTDGKIYFTGSGIPKKTNETEATTGSGTMPINYYPLQVPIPTAALTATPAGGGTGDDRDTTYVWTIVTSWGEESPPSPAATIVSAKNGETVNLSELTLVWQTGTAYTTDDWMIPTSLGDWVYKCTTAGTSAGSEPTWGVTLESTTTDGTAIWTAYDKGILYDSGGGKRIYRSAVGFESAGYYYLTEIAIAATTYADTTEDTDLGASLATDDRISPPEGLTGLVVVNGMLSGFSGKSLYFTDPYLPHAWSENYITLDYTIIGLGVVGNNIIALTTAYPYVITGYSPASMVPKKIPSPFPCISKRSIVSAPQGVIYATNEGLAICDGTQSVLLTKDHFSKEEWEDYEPTTMHGSVHDGRYYGFYSDTNSGGILVDFNSGEVTTLDFYATASHVDKLTDILYYVIRTSDVLLLENGTAYPSQTNALLLEDGTSNLLRE